MNTDNPLEADDEQQSMPSPNTDDAGTTDAVSTPPLASTAAPLDSSNQQKPKRLIFLVAAVCAITLIAVLGVFGYRSLHKTKPAEETKSPSPTASATSTPSTSPSATASASATPSATPSAPPVNPGEKMDLKQIASGDFTSLNGTWENIPDSESGQRLRLEFNGKTAKVYVDNTLWASLDGINGTFPESHTDNMPAVVHTSHNTVSMAWQQGMMSRDVPLGTEIVFFPTETNAFTLDPINQIPNVQNSKPKIMLLAGDAAGKARPHPNYLATHILYPTKDSAGKPVQNKPKQQEKNNASAAGATPCADNPKRGFPCAGQKQLPPDAKKMSAKMDGEYFIVSANGKIGCAVSNSGFGCGHMEWQIENAPLEPKDYDIETAGALNLQSNENGNTTMYANQTAVPCYVKNACTSHNGFQPQELKPGKALFTGNFVCGAPNEGSLACWNHKTGHGAYMTKSKVERF